MSIISGIKIVYTLLIFLNIWIADQRMHYTQEDGFLPPIKSLKNTK